jgi:hypothetical protein
VPPYPVVVVKEIPVSNFQVLMPSRGNPMRPIPIFVAVFFGLMLIVFPVLMQIGGVGTGGTVGVTILIVVTATITLAALRALGNAYEGPRLDLLAGEAWVQWQLAPDEHRRFLADEWRLFERRATGYALAGLVLGPLLGAILDDWLLAVILLLVFLAVAIVILTMARPGKAAENAAAREVRIGARGVHFLEAYLPLQGPGTQLVGVHLQPGDLAELRFDVRTGRRVEEIRMPVPRDRVPEAEEVVERFQRELG